MHPCTEHGVLLRGCSGAGKGAWSCQQSPECRGKLGALGAKSAGLLLVLLASSSTAPDLWDGAFPILSSRLGFLGTVSWNPGMGGVGRDLRDQFTAPLPQAGAPGQVFKEWVNQIMQAPGKSCPRSLGMGSREQGKIWAASPGLGCASHIPVSTWLLKGCAVSSHGQKQRNTWDSVCGCC